MIIALLAATVFAGDWTPTETEHTVMRALSVRDPEPLCADVEALSETPVTTLRSMVENVEMPPWVGMRAATCLASRHASDVEDDLVDWVTDPAKKGLALVALGQLDKMPLPVATEVAQRAIVGSNPEMFRERVGRSSQPELRALVETP